MNSGKGFFTLTVGLSLVAALAIVQRGTAQPRKSRTQIVLLGMPTT